MFLVLATALLVLSTPSPTQVEGTCTTSAGQFGNQFTTCRRGVLICVTEAHGGDAYREFYARTACGALAPPPTPTTAEVLQQQAAGPPIPGRGGPRWEGDDGGTP